MRLVLAIAVAALMTHPLGAEQRGLVSSVTVGTADNNGVVEFTVRGTNPCGAVQIDLGDGRQPVTHPIRELPVTIASEYTRTGGFQATARGMGNCDGAASARVSVASVRPVPPPPPPPPPTPQAAPRSSAPIRFAEMDRNGDDVITQTEWRGTQRSFDVHDWNGDGRLSGDEVRFGALAPDTPGRADARYFRAWSEDQFRALDRNGDSRISRAEWGYDLEDFFRADRNGDNILVLNEFLLARDLDDDRGDRFDYLDANGNNRIERSEWHGSLAAFERLDRNGDGVVARVEMQGAAEVGAGRRAPTGIREAPRTLTISGQRNWTDTGIVLRVGDQIDVTAMGRVYYAPGGDNFGDPNGGANRPATPAAPLPSQDIGALVGRIGETEPFMVGSALTAYQVTRPGRLYFGVNDDVVTDNSGQFRVTVTVTRR